jgi:hypothetical protein
VIITNRNAKREINFFDAVNIYWLSNSVSGEISL